MRDKKVLRRKKFVDWRVQGGIIRHSLFQWMLCLSGSFALLCGFQILANWGSSSISDCAGAVWQRYGACFVILVLLAPIIAYDSINASNRFAGPILRLKRMMNRLADGENVPPLEFRKKDHWPDLATAFNRLRAKVHDCDSSIAMGLPEPKGDLRRNSNEQACDQSDRVFVETV